MENYSQNETYQRAQEQVAKLKRFYTSLVIFLLLFSLYKFSFLQNYHQFRIFKIGYISIILWIWGLILLLKALKLFIFNAEWENREFQKQLKKNQDGNPKHRRH